MDFDKVDQSKCRPNASRFYRENGFGTAVTIQFVMGIEDIETAEFWNCNIAVKQRKLVVVSRRCIHACLVKFLNRFRRSTWPKRLPCCARSAILGKNSRVDDVLTASLIKILSS